ncbi:MAG: alpha,alpha-trehalase [Prevotella sp.]|nr:alpha,alpha-trehalase [Prevotella sp.]
MEQKRTLRGIIALLAAGLLSLSVQAGERSDSLLRPRDLYGQLFDDVMANDSLFGEGCLFAETKSFMDIVPRRNVADILAHYRAVRPQDRRQMEDFLKADFLLPETPAISGGMQRDEIKVHIRNLWEQLTRHTAQSDMAYRSTLIPLRLPYYVPGGRFREVYYWDSYFSMLGMVVDGEEVLIENMVRNFADLIDSLGFVPNGNRTYYLGRSQPPVFSLMVELLQGISRAGSKADCLKMYLPELLREHEFWMSRRTVVMPDGSRLSRYDDAYWAPREEMYREDIRTGKGLPADQAACLYRNLRAAAESGYDFSSRWLKDGRTLSTIRTTDVIPVDLNALLVHEERVIARTYQLMGERVKAESFRRLAEERAAAINRYCYDDSLGYYCDYLLSENRRSPYISAAGIFPLWMGIPSMRQAAAVERMIRKVFLKAGGIVTSPYLTGQQWDAPNGWAPLQWAAYAGLRRYHFDVTAATLADRWMGMVLSVYAKTGKLLEKYNVEKLSDTGGGEYANQDGFGWTNGVFRAFQEADSLPCGILYAE